MAYTKAHSAISWHNTPSTASPLNETNLNKMDNEIGALDDRIVEMSGQMPKKTDFKESNTIEPSVDLNGNVSFSVKDGSLTDAMLSGDPVGHAQQYADEAAASSSSAAGSAEDAAGSATAAATAAENASDAEAIATEKAAEATEAATTAATDAAAQAATQAVTNVETELQGYVASCSGDASSAASSAQAAAESAAQAASGVPMATATLAGKVKGGGNVTIASDGQMNVDLSNLATDSELQAVSTAATNAASAASTAQTTANTAKTNAATAQSTANAAIPKTAMSGTNVNDANKVPTSALVYSINSGLSEKVTYTTVSGNITVNVSSWRKQFSYPSGYNQTNTYILGIRIYDSGYCITDFRGLSIATKSDGIYMIGQNDAIWTNTLCDVLLAKI